MDDFFPSMIVEKFCSTKLLVRERFEYIAHSTTLCPKFFWHLLSLQHSSTHVNYCLNILPLNDTILLRSGTIISRQISFSAQNVLNSFEVNSPPLSDLKAFYVITTFFFSKGFKSLQHVKYLWFLLDKINPSFFS